MADQKPQFNQDLTIIDLNRFSKYDKPPSEGNSNKMSVSVFSNGKIRFNVNTADNAYYGCSVYPFELAIIRNLILPKLQEATVTGKLEDFKAVINVEKLDFRTKVASTTMLVVGSNAGIPYIGFKTPEHKVIFPFTPINKVTMQIKGEDITDEHVAIIYATSYFSDLLNSVDEAFRSLVNMGKNVKTLGSDTPSKETENVSKVFEEDVI